MNFNPHPRLNLLLAVLGVALWLLSPVALSDPTLSRHFELESRIYEEAR